MRILAPLEEESDRREHRHDDSRVCRARLGADAAGGAAPTGGSLDAESREWLRCLRADGATRDEAIARLHALLLGRPDSRSRRRRPTLPHLRGNELDDIALEAADDALMSVLARLDDFRGASRFTTWVYKFALLEAAVKLRRRAWQGREVPLEPESWGLFSSTGLEPDDGSRAERAPGDAAALIAEVLTPHQRRVLVALALNGVPIDVLAERLNTTRGALYKTLHDARRKLRKHLNEQRPRTRRSGWRRRRDGATRSERRHSTGCSGRRSRRSAATSCFERARPLRRARARRRKTPTPPSRACAHTSTAALLAARSTRACARWPPPKVDVGK